jgi:hypothetical protein
MSNQLVVIIPADDRAAQDRVLSANKDAFKYFLTKGKADKLRKMLLFGLDEYERKRGDKPEQF